MELRKLAKKIGIGPAMIIGHQKAGDKIIRDATFDDLITAYIEAPEESEFRKICQKEILGRAKSFQDWLQAYKIFRDDAGLQDKLLKKLKKIARFFNDWMDIYVEIPMNNGTREVIAEIMLITANNLEDLFTLYYVICEESSLVGAVAEKISEQVAPIEKWVEIYERIPRKKEFSKIREIFIFKMSELLEK